MNKAEFKHIFDTYFDSIRSYIYYRLTDEIAASDLAQDVFMRVWEKRDEISTDHIRALLYKIASDMLISHHRKNLVRLDYSRNMSMREVDFITPQEQVQFYELKERYSEALTEMTEQQRITFLMNREEEMKYHEIAERLDVSVKTVEKRISTALRILKKRLL